MAFSRHTRRLWVGLTLPAVTMLIAGCANEGRDLAESEASVLIFATEVAPTERVDALEDAGAQVEIVPRAGGGANLGKMLERCWSLGIRSVLCEGGGRLATALTREELARRLYLFQAPLTLGPQGVPAFGGGDSTPEHLGWSNRGEPIRFGPDVLLTYDYEGSSTAFREV